MAGKIAGLDGGAQGAAAARASRLDRRPRQANSEAASAGVLANRQHPERVHGARRVGDDKREAIDAATGLGHEQGPPAPVAVDRPTRPHSGSRRVIGAGKAHLHEPDHWRVGLHARLQLPYVIGLVGHVHGPTRRPIGGRAGPHSDARNGIAGASGTTQRGVLGRRRGTGVVGGHGPPGRNGAGADGRWYPVPPTRFDQHGRDHPDLGRIRPFPPPRPLRRAQAVSELLMPLRPNQCHFERSEKSKGSRPSTRRSNCPTAFGVTREVHAQPKTLEVNPCAAPTSVRPELVEGFTNGCGRIHGIARHCSEIPNS